MNENKEFIYPCLIDYLIAKFMEKNEKECYIMIESIKNILEQNNQFIQVRKLKKYRKKRRG